MVDLCPVVKWSSIWMVVWKRDWKSLLMVQNVRYLNCPPSHVTVPFEYPSPILLSIQVFSIQMVIVYTYILYIGDSGKIAVMTSFCMQQVNVGRGLLRGTSQREIGCPRCLKVCVKMEVNFGECFCGCFDSYKLSSLCKLEIFQFSLHSQFSLPHQLQVHPLTPKSSL